MDTQMHTPTSKSGLVRPKQGFFATKFFTGRTPVIDVGTVQKVCDDKIQVSSIVHQDFFDGQLRIPESCCRKSFGSSHTNNWSSPSKYFGGERTLFWSEEPIVGGIYVHK